MFSALKKLTRSSDDRCAPPMPMSSSLQKRFSRGVNFNMKILIKGDRNVGKSCLLQRLQGGAFTEEYVPTEQIQVAPIHWTYKNSDYVVKVEVWEVVDKGRAKKKPYLGLKLDNKAATAQSCEVETPVLDATFLDVYKNATGVILMMDITKQWTFEYVVKELTRIPADLPVVLLGNHCDMQHHRQVQSHHIEQALQHAKVVRSAPIRYAESSMRNGFGLRLLHKFFSVPFLRLQKTSLLEQLQRNQKDMEEIEKELDDFQVCIMHIGAAFHLIKRLKRPVFGTKRSVFSVLIIKWNAAWNSEEAHYNIFIDRLANKRRQGAEKESKVNERSPSIVLGAGKPIIPPSVNPLLAQSLNPKGVPVKQTQYVSPELTKSKPPVSMDMTPAKSQSQESVPSTPSGAYVSISGSSGALDEFYAGTLDSSFLDDLAPVNVNVNQETNESDSDEETSINPKVTLEEDDLGEDFSEQSAPLREPQGIDEEDLRNVFFRQAVVKADDDADEFPMWTGDASVRRSPEGGEDPDALQESQQKMEKKHKKKKSKDKDKGDSDISDRKEKKHKRRKSKSEKPSNPQADLLEPSVGIGYNYEDYDSL